jgi:hypothetical protein
MGKIVSIHLAAKAGQATQEMASATLVAAKDLNNS